MASKTTPAKKTASKAKGKATNKWADVQLPEGFKPITQGDYGQEWDFEEMPLLTGTVQGDPREVESGKGKDRRTSRVITVATEDDGAFDVWESAALRPFFDQVADGMSVSVAFQGYKDTGKQSPMKMFAGAISEDDLEAEEAPKKPAKKAAKKR